MEACRLLLLKTCRLRVKTIQIASVLWLLLLLILIHRIPKPIDPTTLLISLIPASLLRLLTRRGIVEQRGCITLFKLLPPQFFLFLAELDSLSQIIIVIFRRRISCPSLLFFFRLIFAGFDGKTIFCILLIVSVSRRLGLSTSRSLYVIAIASTLWAKLVDARDPSLPTFSVRPFCA